MTFCETSLLLSPVLPELNEVTRLSPPGLPHRVLDSGLIDRVSSPDENGPPLGSATNKKAAFYRLTRNPLSDVTKLYYVVPAEASQNAAHSTPDKSTTNCPTPHDNLVNIDRRLQPVIIERSSRINSDEYIPPPFDPFADDPAGPTQHLPSNFQGPLSDLWPQRREVLVSPAHAILCAFWPPLPSVTGFSPALFSAESIFSPS